MSDPTTPPAAAPSPCLCICKEFPAVGIMPLGKAGDVPMCNPCLAMLATDEGLRRFKWFEKEGTRG